MHEYGTGMRIFQKFAGVRIRTLVYEKKTLVYEFGPGVRIFKKVAGVRIRTLVYEKKNSAKHPPWCWSKFCTLSPKKQDV